MKFIIILYILFSISIAAGANNTSIQPYQEYNSTGNGTYSSIPDNSGFDRLLKEDGLCSTVCQISDGITFLNRYVEVGFYGGLLLMIMRFKSMRD